ncbi:MAG: 50S ribosomal protein L10 [Elusimicrobia bacterium CG_4_10_14_0_2_um_filter_56_8]|nr:MAG: 50S ribosomal protein L10 [Elusimicrobia bacterium CG1_02_56_21]PJA13574.1 MAG: 50S ribosomal protein L10 [Elusimicrobia bacterium CG_4_10_14_0_2_um_filter_56_8]
MKINKTQKKELSDTLAKELAAKDSFIATFSGMKFKDANGLRDNLRATKSRFKVVRNTIVEHALVTAALKSGDATLTKGPTALVTMEDPDEITRVAKELMAFAKTNPGVKWKGGFSDKKWLSPEDIEKLSKIGSKTELLSQLAGMLYTNIAQIRYVLDALKEQKEKAEAAK